MTHVTISDELKTVLLELRGRVKLRDGNGHPVARLSQDAVKAAGDL